MPTEVNTTTFKNETLKTLLKFSLLFLFCACSSHNNIPGQYVLNKAKNNSYNIILRLDENKKYILETQGTEISGTIEGDWVVNNNVITLIPNKPKFSNEVWGDTIVEVEAYRPFADTIQFVRKRNKLVRTISLDKMVLFKY